jgi:hypothetical protein
LDAPTALLAISGGYTAYANVMATIAVFLALGGAAYAALGKNRVKAKQIAPNAVGSSELKSN